VAATFFFYLYNLRLTINDRFHERQPGAKIPRPLSHYEIMRCKSFIPDGKGFRKVLAGICIGWLVASYSSILLAS
jgi:hypothetical protein